MRVFAARVVRQCPPVLAMLLVFAVLGTLAGAASAPNAAPTRPVALVTANSTEIGGLAPTDLGGGPGGSGGGPDPGPVHHTQSDSSSGAGSAPPPQKPAPQAPSGGSQQTPPPGRKPDVFDGGKGGRGLDDRVSGLRVMDPVTKGKFQRPNGYFKYTNKDDQAVDPQTGRTIANSDPKSHIEWGPK